MKSPARQAREKHWWQRASLTVQAVGILALAIGPLLGSTVLLGFASHRDAALDREIAEHRETRLSKTELLKAVIDAETGVRGFLLTEDDRFLQPYRAALREVPRLLDEHADDDGLAAPDEHGELARAELAILDRLVQGSEREQALLLEGKAVMGRFRASIREVVPLEDQIIAKLRAERSDTSGLARAILIGGGVASAAGATVGGTLLLRGIVRRLRVVTDNARRVAEGEELEAVRGGDEIGQLQEQLERSAHLLRARESQLRQAKEEADRANQAKSDFISRMSHELRTPLNAILGFAQILREDADEATSSDVGQILRAGRHLLSLINEVLDLSRIEAGQFAISLEQVAVAEVVEECVELMGPLASQRGIRIINNARADSSLHVMADRQRLKQVFLNLLSNAVKYNKDGGAVELGCSTRKDGVRLTVRDTGPGIADGNLDQLFVPFARLGAEATEVEGTGLGLALSLRLMQLMDGDMGVAVTGPEGSEFWLELKRADAIAAVTQVDNAGATQAPVREGTVRILQVEDNPTNIRLLERIMSRRPGVELITVQEGNRAVAEAKRSGPALVLLDVNLPDISGRDVLARLRAEPATANIPVIMLSADASPKQIERLLASGAAAYVTKPLDVNHFLSVIDQVLDRGAA